MSDPIQRAHFNEAFLTVLSETFESVQGIYLDKGTSIFETLATISAQDASKPVSATCASIAAQVAHMTYFMDRLLKWMEGDRTPADWPHIWRTVQVVDEAEWAASQQKLREAHGSVRELAQNTLWKNANEIAGAMGLLAHNAYHLGEIRQALCTVQPDR